MTIVTDELPKHLVGKVLRRALVEAELKKQAGDWALERVETHEMRKG